MPDPCCPPADCAPLPAPAGPVDGPEADVELAELARALGHPARVHILRYLARQGGCIAGDIADQLPLAPSTVSQHLSRLREAGLVQGEVDGPRRCYCLAPATLTRLQALLAALAPESP